MFEFNLGKVLHRSEQGEEPTSQSTSIDTNIETLLKSDNLTPETKFAIQTLKQIADFVRSPDSGFRDASAGLNVYLYRNGPTEVMFDTGFSPGVPDRKKARATLPFLRVEFRFSNPNAVVAGVSAEQEERQSYIFRQNHSTNEIASKFWTSTTVQRGLNQAEIMDFAKTYIKHERLDLVVPGELGYHNYQTEANKTEDSAQVLNHLQETIQHLHQILSQKQAQQT